MSQEFSLQRLAGHLARPGRLVVAHVVRSLQNHVADNAVRRNESENMMDPQVQSQVLTGLLPVMASAGFAGVVCLILLWIIHKVLDKHSTMMIKNTATLEEVAKDLKDIATALRQVQGNLERRR